MVRPSAAIFFTPLWCFAQGAAAQYSNCTNGTLEAIGDGQCNAENNNPSCGFDGGDCCLCTCSDGPLYSCTNSSFDDCEYPECPSATTSDEADCTESFHGDGFCDFDENNLSCGFDGGDCCECSCVDGPIYSCGFNGYSCLDPACLFDPEAIAEFPDCDGDWLMVGDGFCSVAENNALCGYDGGDCCQCTCSGVECTGTFFDCLDPTAYDELYECAEPPQEPARCSANSQGGWVVENTAQANALVAALNCSGGSFEVEWRGSVAVSQTFYVMDGTTLRVTGAGSGATIDGGGTIRLFTVTNATLHLNGVTLASGASLAGGAIAAAGSRLVLDQTSFFGNRAAATGGAVFVSKGSSVSCAEGVTFTNNRADVEGGAMYVAGNSAISCGAVWVNNTAAAARGGALSMHDASSITWSDGATFLNNSAGTHGGALYAFNSTSASWSGATTFVANRAEISGGAVNIYDGASLSWNATTGFYSNSAGFGGGALLLSYRSNISWSGAATFSRNSAEIGGALYVQDRCIASWSASTTVFVNNEATTPGGAVFVGDRSILSWGSEADTVFAGNLAETFGGAVAVAEGSRIVCSPETVTTFSNNSAGMDGGAILLDDSSVAYFDGNTSFDGNIALGDVDDGGRGGALCLLNSNASWSGLMTFTGNTAGDGGGLFAYNGTVVWDGETTWARNSAASQGGAFLAASSNVFWSGSTTYLHNSAGSDIALAAGLADSTASGGGAIAASSADISWNDNSTVFSGNHADFVGGAIFAYTGSAVFWSGDTVYENNSANVGGGLSAIESGMGWSDCATTFDGNVALSGGAMHLVKGSSVEWAGTANFASNHAFSDGGVVGSLALDVETNPQGSSLTVNGATSFLNNSCGANGGVMSLLGGLSLEIGAVDVSFVGNSAAVAGGAVFVSGTGVGPVFTDVSFISNSAQVGGAVSTVGSGTLKISGDIVPPNPTTFDNCRFVDNVAAATGGAIESASGWDSFVNSKFVGNRAGTGGALRLAGTASVDNCSFVENVSDEGGGAAVSNIGAILRMDNVSFRGNSFHCQATTFLNYTTSDDPDQAACSGCPECYGCLFEESPLVPICSDVLDHSSSTGGSITLESLVVERGYWRATPSSTNVLACYHPDACLGGVTGATGYCHGGYEGPYCAICSDGYTAQLGSACSKCSGSAGGIVLAVALSVVALLFAAAVVAHLVSGEVASTRSGMAERFARHIPLQSVKIVIVAWQILTQFASVAYVTYPDLYQHFLDGLDVFNLDLGWILSAGCVVDVDFHGQLLFSTLGPILVLLFLAGTYVAAASVHRGEADALRVIWNKHVSMALLLTFFVYSSVSSKLFKTFACEELDDGRNYLRADYRIECDSPKHEAFKVYAGFMIVLYTAGIPAFYAFLLFRHRDIVTRREEDALAAATSDLWTTYKPARFYYELIEFVRRICLTGVVVFIYPNTAAQIAITLIMAVVFSLISEGLAPYASKWDAWLSRMGHAVVCVSMYVALLLKVDVSDERAASQKVFDCVLIAVHACMVLVTVAETLFMACSLSSSRENPWPASRTGIRPWLFRRRVTLSAKDNPFSRHVRRTRKIPSTQP